MTYGMVRMPGMVTALSPLSHNGDTPGGNATRLRHQVMMVDGVQRKIPYVSGNAVRGYLRRRAMTDMLRRIGYAVDTAEAGGKRLWHAMYSGGILQAASGMDLAAKRRVYDTIPMLRLFGWAWGNQMIESKMKVANMMPVCSELDGGDNPPIRRCTHTIYHTRRDDRQVESDDGGSSQMIYNTEVFVAGTKFRHEFAIEDPTDLDVSALRHVIDLWRAYPTIGGKSAIGLGNVDIQYDYGGASPDAYAQYLKDSSDTIRVTLDGLVTGKV